MGIQKGTIILTTTQVGGEVSGTKSGKVRYS